MGSKNGASAVELPLDTLGVDGKARIVLNMIRGTQAARYELLLMQRGDAKDDGDVVPGLPTMTFAERRAQLVKGEEDLLASVEPVVLERVHELAAELVAAGQGT